MWRITFFFFSQDDEPWSERRSRNESVEGSKGSGPIPCAQSTATTSVSQHLNDRRRWQLCSWTQIWREKWNDCYSPSRRVRFCWRSETWQGVISGNGGKIQIWQSSSQRPRRVHHDCTQTSPRVWCEPFQIVYISHSSFTYLIVYTIIWALDVGRDKYSDFC